MLPNTDPRYGGLQPPDPYGGAPEGDPPRQRVDARQLEKVRPRPHPPAGKGGGQMQRYQRQRHFFWIHRSQEVSQFLITGEGLLWGIHFRLTGISQTPCLWTGPFFLPFSSLFFWDTKKILPPAFLCGPAGQAYASAMGQVRLDKESGGFVVAC